MDKSFYMPGPQHLLLVARESVVDLLVHGDLHGDGLAHHVLRQLPTVIAEILEHVG